MEGTMKSILVGILLTTTAAWAAEEDLYFQLKEPVIKEIKEAQETEMKISSNRSFDDCDKRGTLMAADLNPIEAIDMADVIVDKIINLGKKVWAVVELGRPVANLKTDTANALPQGVFCWTDLHGWSPTQSKTYQITYENWYGNKVVDFAFRVLYTTGGQVNGQGQYITNATIIPALVDVMWGYTFDAESEVPTVFNSGTAEHPVAGMHMNMKWSVKTVIKTDIRTESFYVGGDGSFKHLD
jgi:hypothetical protein